jgi:hypothetical protein
MRQDVAITGISQLDGRQRHLDRPLEHVIERFCGAGRAIERTEEAVQQFDAVELLNGVIGGRHDVEAVDAVILNHACLHMARLRPDVLTWRKSIESDRREMVTQNPSRIALESDPKVVRQYQHVVIHAVLREME